MPALFFWECGLALSPFRGVGSATRFYGLPLKTGFFHNRPVCVPSSHLAKMLRPPQPQIQAQPPASITINTGVQIQNVVPRENAPKNSPARPPASTSSIYARNSPPSAMKSCKAVRSGFFESQHFILGPEVKTSRRGSCCQGLGSKFGHRLRFPATDAPDFVATLRRLSAKVDEVITAPFQFL